MSKSHPLVKVRRGTHGLGLFALEEIKKGQRVIEYKGDVIDDAEAFQKAIAEYEYQGVYRGVFPVKVNQQRHLVEEVVNSSRP